MSEADPQHSWLKPPLLPIAKGKRLRLSLPRRQIIDLMHFAKKVPSIPVQRRMKLDSLVSARRASYPRPKWALLFARAFAMVAARMPCLRQAYMSFPRPHLYEHPVSIATIAVERNYDGEEAVFFPKFFAPDQQPLADLDAFLRYFKEAPFDEIDEFKLGLFVSRLWRPLRRALWWFALNVFGDVRARVFGTFGVSVYATREAESLHPISPAAYLLNFGTIAANGQVDVRLIYDHRVTDGGVIARALRGIEEVLNDQIAGELDTSEPAVIPFPIWRAA
jgi:hypothetical protein